MRDRQPIGSILQQEVIEATCSSAQVPTVAVVVNGNVPDPVAVLPPTYYPPPSAGINTIPQVPIPTGKIQKFVFK
jgi:hypothetical protein